jgi:hypothetical protein
LVEYGESYCRINLGCETASGDKTPGYPLVALRVTNESIPGHSIIKESTIERGTKPVLFILAAVHARELTTSEIAMRWIDFLLENYAEDPDVTWIVDQSEIWVIPVANPDGRWVTELGAESAYGGFPLLHRKNFNQDPDGDGTNDCLVWPSTNYQQSGVDLNRNYNVGWLPPDVWTSPCSPTYSGLAAASEPEVLAHQELVRSLYADRRGPSPDDAAPLDTSGVLLSLHNYGELVLRPWAYTGDLAPNEEGLQAIGDKMALRNGYRSCRSPECLYFAHGTTDDWTYGELGVAAFTFEIGSSAYGFRPPFQIVDEQWPGNRDALIYAAKIAAQPYQLALGPDVSDIVIGDWRDDGRITITAKIHGQNPIASAELAIGDDFLVPASPAGRAFPMEPADGGFDSLTEEISLTIDSAELRGFSVGAHIVYIYGQDESGSRGPQTAAKLYIPGNTFLPIYFP